MISVVLDALGLNGKRTTSSGSDALLEASRTTLVLVQTLCWKKR